LRFALHTFGITDWEWKYPNPYRYPSRYIRLAQFIIPSWVINQNIIFTVNKKAEGLHHPFGLYTHTTSKCAFQNDWGTSIQGTSTTECRPPSELT
jgi:hypothetical protein